MATKREAKFIISAENRASQTVKKVSGDLNLLSRDLSGLGRIAAPAFGALAVGAGAAGAAIFGLKAIMEKTAEYQTLKASLETATGSVEEAKEAFGDLQEFATKTPYALTEVAGAFIKLKNYGLVPSERALTAYGDTASSMGKSLNDMVEAVADAASGEFERLKEFGIKSKKEGERVIFTFRGVKTEVKNNAADIEEYLIKLGEKNFAGGMERQMATLAGKLSNLDDTWSKFLANLGESGIGDLMGDGIEELIKLIEQLDGKIGDDLAKSIRDVAQELARAATQGKDLGKAIVEGVELGVGALDSLAATIRRMTGGTSEATLRALENPIGGIGGGSAMLDRIEELERIKERAKGFGTAGLWLNDEQVAINKELEPFVSPLEAIGNVPDIEEATKRLEAEVAALTDGYSKLAPEVRANVEAMRALAEVDRQRKSGELSPEAAAAREEEIRRVLQSQTEEFARQAKLREERAAQDAKYKKHLEEQEHLAQKKVIADEKAAELAAKKAAAEEKAATALKKQEEKLGDLGDWAREVRERDEREAQEAAEALLPPIGEIKGSIEGTSRATRKLSSDIAGGPDSVAGSLERAAGESEEFADRATTAAEEVTESFRSTFSVLEEYGEAVTSSLERAIEDFTKDGKLDMGEFARSVLADLAAITAKAAILGGILGNSEYGGNGSGLVGALISGILSGGGSTAPKAIPVEGSYAGGGFTGFGSRSGGVDGRGGFPAILHPNETVIDHTRSGSSGRGDTYITKTVIVRETMPASVVRQITADAENAAVGKVLSHIQRGGHRGRGFTGR